MDAESMLSSVPFVLVPVERKVREEINQVVETTTNDADYGDNCNNRKIYAFFHESLLYSVKRLWISEWIIAAIGQMIQVSSQSNVRKLQHR